jgi:hypothetical protein
MIQKINIDNLIHDLAINELLEEMDDFFHEEFSLYVNGDSKIKEIKPEYLDLYNKYLTKYSGIVRNNISK